MLVIMAVTVVMSVVVVVVVTVIVLVSMVVIVLVTVVMSVSVIVRVVVPMCVSMVREAVWPFGRRGPQARLADPGALEPQRCFRAREKVDQRGVVGALLETPRAHIQHLLILPESFVGNRCANRHTWVMWRYLGGFECVS